ncbi:DNA alkylation repair protein [Rhodococcoides trifolii]|uniref:DNA alkylation repair protein n=1 Tax=Rhodococcoides trifolii TaxID=908250 RepID=A0A917FYW1_9NOCA|nr:DNA alkylation repair protein [Rhodococcus trifolii]GGG14617.1 DNA alkylation repair protein [Rhodococcus trifolii]
MRDDALISGIRKALAAAGNPDRALAQQAYMKSELPYHGITAPELRRVTKPFVEAYAPRSRAEHEDTVSTLWDEVTHREEWYVAIALLRHRAAREWLDPDALTLLRHTIETGAWWDVVDELSSHPVGDVLLHHRPEATAILWSWATDDHPWIRRAAVTSQLRARSATDTDLLRHAISSNIDDTTFWLRKAIGWALREYAKTDPDWVVTEVDQLGSRLSGLSRREALKNIAR